jgi:hypothetical protein
VGVFAPPIHAPFVSREWARYISTLARQTLIKSNEPLPSELLKSNSFQHCPLPQCTVLNAGRAQPMVIGGAGRDRTDDLLLAKQALSQLSYSPGLQTASGRGGSGWIRTIDPRLIKTVL